MKLTRGLNRDVEHQNQPKNTYRDANNLVLSKDTDRLISELGSTKIIDLDQSEVVVGIINIPNGFVLFTQNGFTAPNVIYLYRDGVKSLILNTTLFNFDINYPIFGEYKYNNKGELIIVFTADNDIPRILNVDNLGFKVDSNKEFAYSSDTLKTRLFPKYIQPVIKLNSINAGSGSLNSGIYYIGLQYKLIDNSYTNNSLLTNPIPIYKFNPKDNWYNITANPSKEITSKSININISQLDNNYEYFRLLIIYKTETSINAYITNDYSIINNNITISSLNEYVEVDLADAITDNLSFERIHATTIFNNKLIIGNVEVKEPVKYQKYACNIKSEFVYEDEVTLNQYKDSYKDELVLFNKKGFMPFEIYAFYIRFVGDGEVSEAFHIPGRAIASSDNIPSPYPEDKEVYESAKLWHMRDYSGATSLGTEDMGYWENENEFYPVDSEFDGSRDYNGDTILGGINLSDGNTKVRHHRFPSLQSLERYCNNNYTGRSFIDSTHDNVLYEEISFANPVDMIYPNTFLNVTFTGTVGYIEDSRTFVNNSDNDLVGDLSYGIIMHSVFNTNTDLIFKIDILNLSNEVDHTIIQIINNNELEGAETTSISLAKNRKLRIYMFGGEDGTNYVVDANSYVSFTPKVISYPTLKGKILGVKFSNIYLPNYIKDRFTHFEILYAERTTGNTSIIGNGIINKDGSVIGDCPNCRRFYSFDLLNNKPSLNISYVRDELSIISSPSSLMSTIINEDSTVTIDNIVNGHIENNNVNPVKISKYVTNNIAYTEPSNNIKDEYIHLEFKDKNYNIHGAPIFVQDSEWGNYSRLVTGVDFKLNLYNNFNNQKLVRTGQLIRLSSYDTMTSGKIYGGDTIFNLHGVTNIDDKLIRYYLMPEYSISNIGYRYADEEDITKIFYPKYNLITGKSGIGNVNTSNINLAINSVNIDDDLLYDEIKKILSLDDPNFDTPSDIGEYYGYENVINSVLNIRASLIYNEVNSFNTTFPNRIHRSLPQSTESNNESWRIFKPLEYYDCINNKGKIVALDIDSHSILIEHEYTLTILTAKDNLQLNDSNIVALGSADVFDSRYIEIIPTDEGYIGCQSKWGSIRTKFGNIIVDRQRGKIFVYNNGKVTEITSHGLTRFMKANLNYDTSGTGTGRYDFDDYAGIQFDDNTYIDFATETENTNQYNEIDNPFLGLGIIVAFDDDYDRLIVTRQNRFYLKDVGYIDRSFTMSYNFSIQAWTSAMDLTPNSMVNNRNGVFGVTNYNDASNYKYKGVYKILDSLDKPCDFYDNGYNFQSYINVCFNTPINIDKHYLSFSWNTIVNKLDNINYNKTFDCAIVYAYNRHSDKIKLLLQTYNSGNVTNVDGVWRFNDFLNVLNEQSLDIINNLDIHELQYDDLQGNLIFTNWYEKQPFINTFVVIKLIYDNLDNEKIEINDISSISKVINRI